MLKEIHEQPKALRDKMLGRLKDERVDLEEVDLTPEQLDRIRFILSLAVLHGMPD